MVMAWLLDTNAWITFLKPGQPSGKAITDRLAELQENEILLCSVVKAELWHGAEKYANREARLARLTEIFERYVSLPFDDLAAQHYATIRHDLESRGLVIGPNDLQIAAICVARGLTLVSSNTTEFNRVTGLRVEDWNRT
jgi:tRNA(fMet)-specific endonuclease VapC